jgi:hypothetical protein
VSITNLWENWLGRKKLNISKKKRSWAYIYLLKSLGQLTLHWSSGRYHKSKQAWVKQTNNLSNIFLRQSIARTSTWTDECVTFLNSGGPEDAKLRLKNVQWKFF